MGDHFVPDGQSNPLRPGAEHIGCPFHGSSDRSTNVWLLEMIEEPGLVLYAKSPRSSTRSQLPGLWARRESDHIKRP